MASPPLHFPSTNHSPCGPLTFNGNAVYALRKRQKLTRGEGNRTFPDICRLVMAFTRTRSHRIGPHYTVIFARDSTTRLYHAARWGCWKLLSQRGFYGQWCAWCAAICRFENSWRFPDDNPGHSPGNIRLARILGLSFEIFFRIFGIVRILSPLHCLLTRTYDCFSVFKSLGQAERYESTM